MVYGPPTDIRGRYGCSSSSVFIHGTTKEFPVVSGELRNLYKLCFFFVYNKFTFFQDVQNLSDLQKDVVDSVRME